MNDADGEAIEAVLDGLGVSWKKRGDGWTIPATARIPCEIGITLVDGRARIEGELTSWDEIGHVERAALTLLLRKAEADLPPVRFEIRDRSAVARIDLPSADIERRLARTVDRLVLAARLLSRECAVLLEAETAGWYSRFFGAPAETSDVPMRI